MRHSTSCGLDVFATEPLEILYRAIDKDGKTLDFLLSDRRNAKAAKRFLAKALRRSHDWKPRVINTDKNPAYGEAIVELKKEGLLPEATQHREVKCLNNRLEGDHGKLKRLTKPTLGFQSVKMAYATINGLRGDVDVQEGPVKLWIEAVGGGTEASFVNRLFGVYA